MKSMSHDEVERGVDDALVKGDPGRTGESLRGDVWVIVGCVSGMVLVIVVAVICG